MDFHFVKLFRIERAFESRILCFKSQHVGGKVPVQRNILLSLKLKLGFGQSTCDRDCLTEEKGGGGRKWLQLG